MTRAKEEEHSDGLIIDAELVASWEPILYDLWETYLDGFVHDELFLSSNLLHARNGWERELSPSLINTAKAALVSRMKSKFDTNTLVSVSKTIMYRCNCSYGCSS